MNSASGDGALNLYVRSLRTLKNTSVAYQITSGLHVQSSAISWMSVERTSRDNPVCLLFLGCFNSSLLDRHIKISRR